MKLLFATSISYPSNLANRQQAMAMATEYSKLLGDNFIFGGCDITSPPKNFSGHIKNFSGIQKSFILAAKQLRFAKREGVTHILCREDRLFLFFVLFRPFLYKGIPLFFEDHLFSGGTSYLYRLMMHAADGVIATTSIIKNALIELIPEEKVYVAPHGVDISIFDIEISKQEARKKLGLPEKATIWGYTGTFKTFDSDKGITTILQALAKAQKRDSNIMFVAVGGKEKDKAFYQKQAEELGLKENVLFSGFVDKKTLALYQKACDVLFMPFPYTEYYAYYMLPLKMFEYMASGRPIVASDLPSIREMLNEDNAMLVPPDSPQAVADAADRLVSDHVLAGRIAQKAYANIQHCTWENRARAIIDFMEKRI